MEPILLIEYGHKPYNEIKKGEDCCCNSNDFKGFENYLKKNKLDKVVSFTANGIKANHYVGVVKYKQYQIQILPKLCKDKQNSEKPNEKSDEKIIKNLVYMLSYTKKLDIKITDYANLSKNTNPFLEVLIREYAVSLFDCLKSMTPKNYVREEDNLNYLKGKLNFSKNIRYNCTNKTKFYCEYDEFSKNNILNQLFLFVSKCLYDLSSNNNNKKILSFIINYYCDVDFVRIDKFKADKIRLNRNQELFKRPLNLAKLFIENSSIDLSKNKIENIAIVWDMNVLFEEYICEFIKKHKDKFGIEKICYQKGRRLLRDEKTTYGNTFADAYIEYSNGRIILDTKYKTNNGEINSFSNFDVFQVMTYCDLHNANTAILLYPYSGEEDLKKEDIHKNFIHKFKLNVLNPEKKQPKLLMTAVIDLRTDDLKTNEENIIKQLNCILGEVKECLKQEQE